jgi:hypothetical protein
MSQLPCATCERLETGIQRAYEELAEAKVDSRKVGERAQKKLDRLLSAKHAHKFKQGCSRQSGQPEL